MNNRRRQFLDLPALDDRDFDLLPLLDRPQPLHQFGNDPGLVATFGGEPLQWELEGPKNYKDNNAADANDHPSNSSTRRRHCRICFEDLANAECIRIDCGHHWCNDCFTHCISLALKSEYHYPPECCSTPIAMTREGSNHSDKLFGIDFVKEYLKKEIEYRTPGQLRRYCGNPSCSTFLPEASTQDNAIVSVSCTSCKSITCTACRKLVPRTCDNDHDCKSLNAATSIEDLGYGVDNRCKRCPCCGTFIQLTDACNHIRCGICKHEFCFVCLDEWRCSNDCPHHGDPCYDSEGYDAKGYHRDTGFNKEGYDRRGFDVHGCNLKGERRPIRGPRRLTRVGRGVLLADMFRRRGWHRDPIPEVQAGERQRINVIMEEVLADARRRRGGGLGPGQAAAALRQGPGLRWLERRAGGQVWHVPVLAADGNGAVLDDEVVDRGALLGGPVARDRQQAADVEPDRAAGGHDADAVAAIEQEDAPPVAAEPPRPMRLRRQYLLREMRRRS